MELFMFAAVALLQPTRPGLRVVLGHDKREKKKNDFIWFRDEWVKWTRLCSRQNRTDVVAEEHKISIGTGWI